MQMQEIFIFALLYAPSHTDLMDNALNNPLLPVLVCMFPTLLTPKNILETKNVFHPFFLKKKK
jgi:hypothetical protein